ncbi:hypothetical protein [Acidocella sp.]|uniref:hypothetical protein n=1 Tax=Acidocella sp. TaxID=50710 RepID=UPI003CFD54B0
MDSSLIVDSLVKSLEARLSFRDSAYTTNLANVKAQMAAQGLFNSGRRGIIFGESFRKEALERADTIIEQLRLARLSLSPDGIVQGESMMRSKVIDFFGRNLSAAAYKAEVGGHLIPIQGNMQQQALVNSFVSIVEESKAAAMTIVDSLITEIVVAARSAHAENDRQKPNYTNNFYAPVSGFAQGGSTIGSIAQENSSFTAEELADAISGIVVELLPQLEGDTKAKEKIEELGKTVDELKKGRTPFAKITRALNGLVTIENIAVNAPVALSKIQQLAHSLGI